MGNHGGRGGFLHWDSNVWLDWVDALAYLNFLRLHKAQADLCLCWPHKSFEPVHDKTNKTTCAPSEDSDQPGHPPSLIRVFIVRMNKAWVFSYPLSTQRRLIRLGRCPGSSESLLSTPQVILLVLSCTGWSVFDVCFMGCQWQKLSTGGQQRLWSDWDACPSWMPRQICVFAGHTSHLSQYMIKPTKMMCTQRRLGSAWASAQSDQGLR